MLTVQHKSTALLSIPYCLTVFHSQDSFHLIQEYNYFVPLNLVKAVLSNKTYQTLLRQF